MSQFVAKTNGASTQIAPFVGDSMQLYAAGRLAIKQQPSGEGKVIGYM